MATQSRERFLPSLDNHLRVAFLESKGALLLYLFSTIWLIVWFSYGYHYWEDDAFIHLEFDSSKSVINATASSFL